MGRPAWFVDLIRRTLGARYVVARLTRVPLLGRWMDTALFESDDVMYLPRETRIQIGQSIEPEHTVLPSQVVAHLIGRAQHHWIMDGCICRESRYCADYPTELGCLFLGEAVLQINPKLGRLVTRDEALDHLRRCREAGLVHMVGRVKMDARLLGARPADRMLTICSCCPCCCLMDIIPDLAPTISSRYHRMPTVEVTVSDRCVGCGTCSQDVCFVDAIHLDPEGTRAVIGEACRGCGRCVDVCPQGAIELTYDQALFLESAIEHVVQLVDLT